MFIEGAAGILQLRKTLGGEVLEVVVETTFNEGNSLYSFEPVQVSPGDYWIQAGLVACPSSGCSEGFRNEVLDEAEAGSGIIDLDYPACDFRFTLVSGETVDLDAVYSSEHACLE